MRKISIKKSFNITSYKLDSTLLIVIPKKLSQISSQMPTNSIYLLLSTFKMINKGKSKIFNFSIIKYEL